MPEIAATYKEASKGALTPKPGYRWKFNSISYEQEPNEK